MITDNGELVLMDLGVLKLVGGDSFTDLEEKQFLGTLRNSPPEFLIRHEEDSEQGWRAINLYQIGTVLYNLIMKEELFNNIHPYTNLVIAIKEDAPDISNNNFPYETMQLARDLLIKDCKKRLDVCSSQRMKKFFSTDFSNKNLLDKGIEDIFQSTSNYKSKLDEIKDIQRSNREKADRRKNISSKIDETIQSSFETLKKKGLFISYEKSKQFHFNNDGNTSGVLIKNILYKLNGRLEIGYPHSLYVLVRTINDENSLASILLCGIFYKISDVNMNDPLQLFLEIERENNSNHRILNIPKNKVQFHKYYEAFKGTIGFDKQFEENLTFEIFQIIKSALDKVSKDVESEIERVKNLTDNGKSKVIIRVASVGQRIILVYQIKK